MMPKWHVLYGFLLSYILVYFFNFSVLSGLIIFLASVFIDLDHVLLYCLDTHNLNPKKFWEYSLRRGNHFKSMSKAERDSYKKPHFIFHGIEFFAFCIILSFFFGISVLLLIGFSLHLFLDLFALAYEREHLSVKVSQLWLWQRNKNKKKFGMI